MVVKRLGKKQLLHKALSKPYRVPNYLWWRLGLQGSFNKNVRKRVPFSYEHVVSGWEIDNARLPHFSSRLYREVKLLQQGLAGYTANRSLEIGCGYGRLTPWIMDYSKDHFAVEPEEKLLNDAKVLNPKVHFYHARAQKLSFPDEYFDLVVTWTVIQHMPPKEQVQAVREIKRVANKSAVILITEGTGTFQSEAEWFHTVEDWIELFKPWKLVWQTKRILEETAAKDQGMVMRFEKKY